MARISGVDIPLEKRIIVSLTYIYGIGPSISKKILEMAKVDENIRVKDLGEDEVVRIRKAITDLNLHTEGELRRVISQNIKRLMDIRSYRGSRHRSGLPVRGQRTSRNSRTRKGKRKTVGGLKVKLTKK